MPKCDFSEVAKHGGSPVNLLHMLRTPSYKNTSAWLLLSSDLALVFSWITFLMFFELVIRFNFSEQ